MPYTGADSHAHLDDDRLLLDIAGVLERAAQSGVSLIVHMFLLHERYERYADMILKIAGSLPAAPDICFVRGLHPEDIRQTMDSLWAEEEWEHLSWAVRNDPHIRAVGEIGLDYHYEEGYSPSALQAPWFRKQLRLAKELDKPVVIHARDAWDDVLTILDEEDMRGRPLLWHCFGGDSFRARQIVERGWHIALGGAATFNANVHIREALHEIPLERLMFETDCPYLAPIPWRGKLNEPALSVFTAARMAEELGMDAAELWSIAGNNTRRFFGM
jgi:TatD DNase family protein